MATVVSYTLSWLVYYKSIRYPYIPARLYIASFRRFSYHGQQEGLQVAKNTFAESHDRACTWAPPTFRSGPLPYLPPPSLHSMGFISRALHPIRCYALEERKSMSLQNRNTKTLLYLIKRKLERSSKEWIKQMIGLRKSGQDRKKEL